MRLVRLCRSLMKKGLSGPNTISKPPMLTRNAWYSNSLAVSLRCSSPSFNGNDLPVVSVPHEVSEQSTEKVPIQHLVLAAGAGGHSGRWMEEIKGELKNYLSLCSSFYHGFCTFQAW